LLFEEGRRKKEEGRRKKEFVGGLYMWIRTPTQNGFLGSCRGIKPNKEADR
jgi:hypothetical protein